MKGNAAWGGQECWDGGGAGFQSCPSQDDTVQPVRGGGPVPPPLDFLLLLALLWDLLPMGGREKGEMKEETPQEPLIMAADTEPPTEITDQPFHIYGFFTECRQQAFGK